MDGRFASGLLSPVGVGKFRLEMDFGGIATWLFVEVVRPVATLRISLIGGEIRTWRLPPGRFELLLRSDSAKRKAPHLVLGVYRVNCARGPRRATEQHLCCVSSGGGSVVVRNLSPVGSRSALDAEFELLEIP